MATALRYCPKACFLSGDAAALLVGDALHALPPDIGQGVNSALEDVTVLASCLGGATEAAKAYEQRRMGDAEALVRIVRVAAPFQPLSRASGFT